jgi:hypothetical protein
VGVVDVFDGLREERFPDGIHVLNDITEDRSVRREVLRIRALPEVPAVKEAMWLEYLSWQFGRGILTSDEYLTLRDWNAKW